MGKMKRFVAIAGNVGVGKSTLMGMIARNTSADVNVIGLIGERGREVRDFLEQDLQEYAQVWEIAQPLYECWL